MIVAHSPRDAWVKLGWLEEVKFGHTSARYFPCVRLNPLGNGVPLVQTPEGEARLLHVGLFRVEVVLESSLQAYWSAPAGSRPNFPERKSFRLYDISFPKDAPPEWQMELASAELRRLSNARRRLQGLEAFASLAIIWSGLFALAAWVFP